MTKHTTSQAHLTSAHGFVVLQTTISTPTHAISDQVIVQGKHHLGVSSASLYYRPENTQQYFASYDRFAMQAPPFVAMDFHPALRAAGCSSSSQYMHSDSYPRPGGYGILQPAAYDYAVCVNPSMLMMYPSLSTPPVLSPATQPTPFVTTILPSLTSTPAHTSQDKSRFTVNTVRDGQKGKVEARVNQDVGRQTFEEARASGGAKSKTFRCPYDLDGQCLSRPTFHRKNCLQRHIITFHERHKAPYRCIYCGRPEVRKDHAASHAEKCLSSLLNKGIPKAVRAPCVRRRQSKDDGSAAAG